MKKALLYFIAIVIGDFLFTKYAYSQSEFYPLTFIGIVVYVISILQFPVKFAGLFFHRDFSFNELYGKNSVQDKSLHKPLIITVIALFFLIGFHVWGFIAFDHYQKKLLANGGIYIDTVIIDKKKKRGREAGYYVYYSYSYNGTKYNHDKKNDSIEIGDTIQVKFLPENPDNHEIYKKE